MTEWIKTAKKYNGYTIYQHPITGEYAYEAIDRLVELPKFIEEELKTNAVKSS